MNLDIESGAEDSYPPLAPPEWTMDVEMGESGYYVGIVSRQGKKHCRISLNANFPSIEEARTALAIRARLWIAEYLERSSGGEAQAGDPS